MGTVTSGNIVAGALESRAAPSSNTFVSHANSTVTIESSTEYAAGGQEIETYNLTTLNPAEAFVYEKRGVGKKQGYPGLCIVSDQKDGSQVFVDRGPSRHPLTVNGNIHHDSGGSKFIHNPTSIYFDGTLDHLSMPAHTDFNFSGDFTIEMWINASSSATYDGLITFDGSGAADLAIGFNNSNVLYLYTNAGSATENVNSSVAITSGQWYHVAVTRSNNTTSFFLDGVLKTTNTYSTSWVTGSNGVKIGRFYAADDEKYFEGYMDDIRIINGKAIYTKNFIPSSRSPKGTEAIGDIADYTKITMVGYQEDSASYFTAINYVAGDEIIARDYMGISYDHLQAVAYGGGTQKVMIFNNSIDALSFTTYVESTT